VVPNFRVWLWESERACQVGKFLEFAVFGAAVRTFHQVELNVSTLRVGELAVEQPHQQLVIPFAHKA
jgi:hypothetical protein